MPEEKFQVFCEYGNNKRDLVASDMTIETAMILVKAYFERYYNEPNMQMVVSPQESRGNV